MSALFLEAIKTLLSSDLWVHGIQALMFGINLALDNCIDINLLQNVAWSSGNTFNDAEEGISDSLREWNGFKCTISAQMAKLQGPQNQKGFIVEAFFGPTTNTAKKMAFIESVSLNKLITRESSAAIYSCSTVSSVGEDEDREDKERGSKKAMIFLSQEAAILHSKNTQPEKSFLVIPIEQIGRRENLNSRNGEMELKKLLASVLMNSTHHMQSSNSVENGSGEVANNQSLAVDIVKIDSIFVNDGTTSSTSVPDDNNVNVVLKNVCLTWNLTDQK